MRKKVSYSCFSVFCCVLLMITMTGNCLNPVVKGKEAMSVKIGSHNKAVHVMDEWMRDPYIFIGPDNQYYLTCTRLWNSPFKPGMELWKSKDLVNWENQGLVWAMDDSKWMPGVLAEAAKEQKREAHLWAPELYFFDGRWVSVYTSSLRSSNLITTKGKKLEGPFEEPFGADFGNKHDPSIFNDTDGSKWLIWGCTKIAPLKQDLSAFSGPVTNIAPSNRKMGHEGCFILKIEGKYVLFGTAWSTDIMRHGSYNLYYCTANQIEGPYDSRKFAGRFLGHGTIFKDKKEQWWCTAFLNGDYVTPEQVIQNGVSIERAETINKQGLTLVPMDIRMENGKIIVRAKDPIYAYPGKDEKQGFLNSK